MVRFSVRPEVADLRPYVAGKGMAEVRERFGIKSVVKLASNENPLGPSPRALTATMAGLPELNRYPDVTASRLRAALAGRLGVTPEWILVGNGSDEVLRLVAATYIRPGDLCLLPACSFPNYRSVSSLFGGQVAEVELRDETMDLERMAAAAADVRIIFLCRPNNPTGTVFSEEEFQQFLSAVPPSALVLLDEAYGEFDGSAFDAVSLLRTHPNLMLTRTFSKAYGLAGLRVGYGVAHPEVWDSVWSVREPFSVNALAQEAALAALEDGEHLERTLANNREGLAALEAGFRALGLSWIPSRANFLMVDVKRPAGEVSTALMSRGVIVRDCGPFGRPTWLRVTVGRPEQVGFFLDSLSEVL